MDSWMFLMLYPFTDISHMFKLYKCGPWKPIGKFFQVKLLWIGFCLDEIIHIYCTQLKFIKCKDVETLLILL